MVAAPCRRPGHRRGRRRDEDARRAWSVGTARPGARSRCRPPRPASSRSCAELDTLVEGLAPPRSGRDRRRRPDDIDRGTGIGAPRVQPAARRDRLRRRLRERFGLPIGVENDGNATALAEWRLGAGRGARDLSRSRWEPASGAVSCWTGASTAAGRSSATSWSRRTARRARATATAEATSKRSRPGRRPRASSRGNLGRA